MNNPVNERLLRAFEYLKDRGMVASQKAFAEALGFPEQHFAGYRTGQRNIQLGHITNLFTVYGVSLTYMVIGTEPIMDEEAKKQAAPELARQLKEEKAKRELLEREREVLLQQIAFYQEMLKERLK